MNSNLAVTPILGNCREVVTKSDLEKACRSKTRFRVMTMQAHRPSITVLDRGGGDGRAVRTHSTVNEC